MSRTMTSATGTDDDSSTPGKIGANYDRHTFVVNIMLSVLQSSVVQGVMTSHDATTNTTTTSTTTTSNAVQDVANAKQP